MNVQSIEERPYIQNPLIAPIIHFHSRAISTFDDLPENGKVVEIATRIATLVISPLAYPALGILALIGLVYHSLQRTNVSDPEQVQQTVTNKNSTTIDLGLGQPQQAVTTEIMPQTGVSNLETHEKDSSLPIDLEAKTEEQEIEELEKKLAQSFTTSSAIELAEKYKQNGNTVKEAEWHAKVAETGDYLALQDLKRAIKKDPSISIDVKVVKEKYKNSLTEDIKEIEKEMETESFSKLNDRQLACKYDSLAYKYEKIGDVDKAKEWYLKASQKGKTKALNDIMRLRNLRKK